MMAHRGSQTIFADLLSFLVLASQQRHAMLAGNDVRANHASGIQAPLTRVVATPCYRAPEVSVTLMDPCLQFVFPVHSSFDCHNWCL